MYESLHPHFHSRDDCGGVCGRVGKHTYFDAVQGLADISACSKFVVLGHKRDEAKTLGE